MKTQERLYPQARHTRISIQTDPGQSKSLFILVSLTDRSRCPVVLLEKFGNTAFQKVWKWFWVSKAYSQRTHSDGFQFLSLESLSLEGQLGSRTIKVHQEASSPPPEGTGRKKEVCGTPSAHVTVCQRCGPPNDPGQFHDMDVTRMWQGMPLTSDVLSPLLAS